MRDFDQVCLGTVQGGCVPEGTAFVGQYGIVLCAGGRVPFLSDKKAEGDVHESPDEHVVLVKSGYKSA